ncbi:MAG: nucleoside deaminase [Clostridia bacterium]|nr:nucleoside deaminase [Clostridia bacterium]
MGEIPIGAVIVKDGEIIGKGYNQVETLHDPTCHAEIIAIKEACKKTGNHRLTGCELYVTVEPCSMCAGAIVWARISKVHIGTMDEKSGACGSVYNLIQEERFNHRVEIEKYEIPNICQDLMQNFFKDLRRGKKSEEIK